MSDLESLQSKLKMQESNLFCVQREIKRIEEEIRLRRLIEDSNGKYGKNCRHWMKDCWTFKNCIYADICIGNQLRGRA